MFLETQRHVQILNQIIEFHLRIGWDFFQMSSMRNFFFFIIIIMWFFRYLVTILFTSHYYWQSLESNCGGKFFNVDPSNAKCSNGLQAYHQVRIIIKKKTTWVSACIFHKLTSLFVFEFLVYLRDIHRADFITKLQSRLCLSRHIRNLTKYQNQ